MYKEILKLLVMQLADYEIPVDDLMLLADDIEKLKCQ